MSTKTSVNSINGRGVINGLGEGHILVSKQPFMFAHGVDPETGRVIDVRSDIFGKNIRNKVLVFPYGKGSTTGSAWFLEAIRLGNGPAAVINDETEPIIASALIIARILYDTRIPLADRLEQEIPEVEKDKVVVLVEGNKGLVTLKPKS